MSAVVGSLFSLLIFFDNIRFLLITLIKLPLAAVLVLIAFGYHSKSLYIKSVLSFFAVNFIFGGVMMAVWMFISPSGMYFRNGTVYFNISALTLIAGTLIAYFLIQVVSYLQGYGDTTTDEINAAIQANPEAFISVGMATTFFTQQLNAAGIEFSDIDSFTNGNGEAIKSGKLVYLAGKYSSSVGPAFALVMNAVNGNVIRDAEGNAISVSQNYLVATDEESFDKYYVTDNGDNPIYNKETLDTIIGDSVTSEDIIKLAESK